MSAITFRLCRTRGGIFSNTSIFKIMGMESTSGSNLPSSPTFSVYNALESDLTSPLYRLRRLQSFLQTVYIALEKEFHSEIDSTGISHLIEVVKFCREESEEIDGDLESWFKERPTDPIDFQKAWEDIGKAETGPFQELFDLQSLLWTFHIALQMNSHKPLESIAIQHMALVSEIILKKCQKISTGLKNWSVQ